MAPLGLGGWISMQVYLISPPWASSGALRAPLGVLGLSLGPSWGSAWGLAELFGFGVAFLGLVGSDCAGCNRRIRLHA